MTVLYPNLYYNKVCYKSRILHDCSCFNDFINQVGASQAFYLFCNKLKTFNNTGALMLDFIYHMTLKLF